MRILGTLLKFLVDVQVDATQFNNACHKIVSRQQLYVPIKIILARKRTNESTRISFGIIISYVFVRIELHNERNVLALYFRVSYSLKKLN